MAVPTQPVRPTSRKQKDHSLKAYFSSRLDSMELKILEQPEPQHRARYQTEGSRGAIKDASQNGFPMIKVKTKFKRSGSRIKRIPQHFHFDSVKI